MDLLKNPFNILATTPRDNRQRIAEQANAHILLEDWEESDQARSDLLHHTKRLSAEIAWLPGLSPRRSTEVLQMLQSLKDDPEIDNSAVFWDVLGMGTMTPIAQTNLLASWLSRSSEFSPNDVAEAVLEIAQSFEHINPEELRITINDERIASGFREITDLSAVESQIEDRRRYYRRVIESALETLKHDKYVEMVTIVVDSATNNGERHGLTLIDDLVDSYQLKVEELLNEREGNIKTVVDKLRISVELSESVLARTINQLIGVVKNWDEIAQPIQINTKSRGLTHEASIRVAGLVRELAIDLNNEHGKLGFSQKLMDMLEEVFAEVVEVADRTAKDKSALNEIAEQIDVSIKRTEEWREEITFEADIGAVFKKKLRISPEGIEWKGRRWDLDSISRVRWGATRHSVNGIPTGTTYDISFGDESDSASVRLKKETVYSNFVGRLWRGVCLRMLIEYLKDLRDGRKIRFGTTTVSDDGVELARIRLFSSNEQDFCSWGEVEFWNHDGKFYIGKKDDRKLVAAFSYQDEDNVHLLDAMIRMMREHGGNRLSDALENWGV